MGASQLEVMVLNYGSKTAASTPALVLQRISAEEEDS